jgi:hypothetical protein
LSRITTISIVLGFLKEGNFFVESVAQSGAIVLPLLLGRLAMGQAECFPRNELHGKHKVLLPVLVWLPRAALPLKGEGIMPRKNKPSKKRRGLIFESLEFRSLLSGFHTPHVQVADHHPAIINTAASVRGTLAAAKSAGAQSETHLVATLVDPAGTSTVTGTARFESETENGVVVSQLSIQVKGGTPGAKIDVAIADSTGTSVSIGQIVVNADGTGQLKLTSGVPAVTASSVISLNTTDAAGATTLLASGTFAVPTGNPCGSHDHGGEQGETHLTASLADPNSQLTGRAHFESETESGTAVNKLHVAIKGATPGAVIDVSLAADSTSASSSIGQITIGADGTGRLKLNTGLPAVTSTSVVTLSAVTTAADGTVTTTPITSATFAVPTHTAWRMGH